MAIDPALYSELNATAATCQTAYDAFLASIPAYNAAHDAMRKAVLDAAPGVPLVRAGTGEPATNFAINALITGQPFDFLAAVENAWGEYAAQEAGE
ncbi:hypothetical protein ACFFP0_14320 [Rhizobium puerariae]|uniref:Uncharacterized protein n=1 Tax=Rhizobium puerariae TaxID=1585791 RepID=A0ABV6AIX3_9HYPH